MHVITHTRNQNCLTALKGLEVSVGHKVKMLKSLKWRSEERTIDRIINPEIAIGGLRVVLRDKI